MAIPGTYTYPNVPPGTPGTPPVTPPTGGGTTPGAGGGWWRTLLEALGIQVTPEMQAKFDAWRTGNFDRGRWGGGDGARVGGWRDDGDDVEDGAAGTGETPRTGAGGFNPPTVRVKDYGANPESMKQYEYSWGGGPGGGSRQSLAVVPWQQSEPASASRNFGLGSGSVAGSTGSSRPAGTAAGTSPAAPAASSPSGWLSAFLNGWR